MICMLNTYNIQFADTSELISEVRRLQDEKAPASVVEVILHMLSERKSELEMKLERHAIALNKAITFQSVILLTQSCREIQQEIEIIGKVLKQSKSMLKDKIGQDI